MPRVKIDYSKAIIYKLVCNDLDVTNLYVGSTTRFSHRKTAHKQACCNPNSKKYNYNVYQFIRANDGWDNWSMIEVEKYPCTDANELRSRERYWIEQLNATLNKQVPGRTKKEYQKDHYDQNKEHYKDYYEQNKQTIKEYQKDHYEQNKERIKEQKATPYNCACGSTITLCEKARHFRSIKHTKYIESIKQVQ